MPRSSADDDTVALGKDAVAAEHGDDDALPVRTRLAGRYEIVDFLGRGGMGSVYLAIDEALGGKPVALKVVARERAEMRDALAELRSEVLLAQQVTHKNVCRIYDLEHADDRWMIKMECISGETLSARLARGPLTIAQVLDVARQIALGLGAAHAQGVIHRDLKPGNVMIEQGTGRVVLMDFGIARVAGGESSDHAGTPAYMAPEQVRGERISSRSDVYALGCVLYHMLVGEVAFPASLPEVQQLRQLEDAPPDPRGRRADVPAWLARAVLTMLDKDPAKRPGDPAELTKLLAGPAPKRTWILAAAAGVAVLAVGAFFVLRAPASRPSWHPVIVELEPGYDENSDSLAFSPDGQHIAYSTDREHPGWLRAHVRGIDPADDTPDVAVTAPEENALNVGWTHDGESLYYTDAAQGMASYQIPLTGGAPTKIGDGYAADCGGKMLRYEFSSPGCPSCPRFVLRDDDGAEREVLRLDENAFVTTARCDRAGTELVWSRAEQGAPFYQPADVWIADVATGKARQLTHDRARNAYPTFTPDGKHIVFTSARGGGVMNLWEMTRDGGDFQQLTFGEGNDLLADVSPDGTKVVFNVDITSAPLFSYAGPVRTRKTPARVILIDPQATPDGALIVAADFAPLTAHVVAVSTADGSVRVLADGVVATVTPDGANVVFAQDGVPAQISEVPLAGGDATPLAQLPGRIRSLRVGPDGVIHAMVDRQSTIEAWAIVAGVAKQEADAPWCFVQPAPAGGWSLWMRCAGGAPTEGVLVAPGTKPDAASPGIRMRGPMFFGGDFTAKGDAFFAYDQPTVEKIDVATGAVTHLFDTALYGATPSPDGSVVYTTEPVGSVRRHMITNFADRR